jgi:hypothetical protein
MKQKPFHPQNQKDPGDWSFSREKFLFCNLFLMNFLNENDERMRWSFITFFSVPGTWFPVAKTFCCG